MPKPQHRCGIVTLIHNAVGWCPRLWLSSAWQHFMSYFSLAFHLAYCDVSPSPKVVFCMVGACGLLSVCSFTLSAPLPHDSNWLPLNSIFLVSYSVSTATNWFIAAFTSFSITKTDVRVTRCWLSLIEKNVNLCYFTIHGLSRCVNFLYYIKQRPSVGLFQ